MRLIMNVGRMSQAIFAAVITILVVGGIASATTIGTNITTDGNLTVSGNVGIGTTSPSSKLTVNGDVNLTTTGGGFKLTGNSATTTAPNIVAGYSGNSIADSGSGSSILGGGESGSFIGYSLSNVIESGVKFSVIAGGAGNAILTPSMFSGNNFIGAGTMNIIGGDVSAYSAIVAGQQNEITGFGQESFIGGGYGNTIDATTQGRDVIVGGEVNKTFGNGYSSVVGGQLNTAWHYSFVGGGYNNTAGANGNNHATVAGGMQNSAIGYGAAIPGGRENTASGTYSFAAGRRAKATASGVFALADSTDADFTVDTADVFGARFNGGYWLTGGNVGIGTETPAANLQILDTVSDGQDLFRIGTSGDSALFSIEEDGGLYSRGALFGDQVFIYNNSSDTNNIGGMSDATLRIVNNDMTDNNYASIGFGTSGSVPGWSFSGQSVAGIGAQFLEHESATEVDLPADLYFWTGYGTAGEVLGTPPGERMRITAAGNVGIGTSTPDANLQVYGGDSATSTVEIGGSANTTQGACLKLRDSDGAGWTYCTTLDGTLSCSQTSCE